MTTLRRELAVFTVALAAALVTPTVVMDGQVQLDGAAITDQALQTATENAINKMM